MAATAKRATNCLDGLQTSVRSKESAASQGTGSVRLRVASPKLREKLSALAAETLEFEVVGTENATESKRSAGRTLHSNTIEVLVMNASGAVQEDLQKIREAKTGTGELKTLLLGAPQNEADLLRYLRAGVSGLVAAEATAEEVLAAAQAVKNGQAICPGTQCAMLFRYIEKEGEAFPSAALHRDLGLTRREQQLIPFLTRGLTNKEIANHFSLSEQTVKNHLYRMKRKVGANGRLEIVDVCRQHGFSA
ncbi:MAG: response regulator transcription factor [Acidobacteria bacterium]|nr:response regulator transcription factor [Acidobacteriota bacterium]MBS1866192.1 response regulator transcription factor [Acidobacteriota bacterium]